MPDDENGNTTATNPRRIEAAAELQRTEMWQLVGGLLTGRVWFMR